MPGTFRSKNGATLSGHSDKWSEPNRRVNSNDAGQGRNAGKSQGTGEQGILNKQASQGVDTTKMNPAEKLKYFKSLGLMPGSAPTPEPEEEPKDPVFNSRNKIQALTQDLAKIFASNPGYLSSIISTLKHVEPAKFKTAVFSAYRAMQEITAKDNVEPYDVMEYIQDAILNSTIE